MPTTAYPHIIRSAIFALLLLVAQNGNECHAWVSSSSAYSSSRKAAVNVNQVQPARSAMPLSKHSTTTTSLNMIIPTAVASLVAGSVAGALGVGVAYPLDTVKTRSQILAVSQSELTTDTAAASLEQIKLEKAASVSVALEETAPTKLVDFGMDETMVMGVETTTTPGEMMPLAAAATTTTTTPQQQKLVDFERRPSQVLQSDGTLAVAAIPIPGAHATMTEVAKYIYATSGVTGFFGGVQTSMLGQGIIKAVVFAVNAAVLQYSQQHHLWGDDTALQLLSAAALAGFVTSFLAAPVDRIKVLMQCSDHECYHGDETECVDAVLQQEGWKGFLTRGLGCTMLREIPAYSLYFGVYGGLQAYCGDLTAVLGPTLAAALYGATAGCACWLPIYPIDVIRTVALNTEGDDSDSVDIDGNVISKKSSWELAVDLYETAGWEAFYDGLGARMARQAVNHAVTFSVYEMLMQTAVTLQQQPDVFG